MLSTIYEETPEENINEITVLNPMIWKKLPKELVDMIMKQYLFSLENLESACEKNDIQTIQFICHNCKLDWNRCLILASMNGYLHTVKLMIKLGATDKLRALMTSALFGHNDIKQFLKKLID